MNEQMKSALIGAPAGRRGAVVTAPRGVIQVLRQTGMIGEGNGLTERGLAARAALIDDALDDAFGVAE